MDKIIEDTAQNFWKSVKRPEQSYNGVDIPYLEVQINVPYEISKGSDFDIDKPIEI